MDYFHGSRKPNAVRFATTRSFDADFKRLKPEPQQAFRIAVRVFSSASDDVARTPGYRWPSALRVAPMKVTRGIWEMTWRRIGDHEVFRAP